MESAFQGTSNVRRERSRFWLDIIYPCKCPFCGKAIRWYMLSCEKCFSSICWTDERFCPKCGLFKCICGEREIPYERFYSAMIYNGSDEVVRAFSSFKYHNNLNLNGILCDMLAYKIRNSDDFRHYDMIIPMPMNKFIRHERGYNQAEIMSEELAKQLGSVSRNDIIFKKYSRKFQHELNREERAVNAGKQYYAGNVRIDGKTVLLCDDIVTTGSSVIKCASLLRELGAERVDAAAGAVTCHIM